MNNFIEKQHLQVEVVNTEYLLKIVGDNPFMSVGLKEKIENLKSKLSSFKDDFIEPKISFLFSGNAVEGSIGIKSSFVSKILSPIEDLIKVQAANSRLKKVGKRGPLKGANTAEMFLTSLPIGSYGIELTQLNNTDLFSENDVSAAILQVTEIISKTTESDESFAQILDEISLRSLNKLKCLLGIVSQEGSIIKMQFNNKEIFIDKDQVKLGFDRIKKAEESQLEIIVNGIFEGLLLESNKFEFISDTGKHYKGNVCEEIDRDELIKFAKENLNEQCTIKLITTTITLPNGKPKESYLLIALD